LGIGTVFLSKYNNLLSNLFPAIYPEYPWLPWKFVSGGKHFWSDEKQIKNFINWAGKQLGIKQFSDWENITNEVSIVTDNILKKQDIFQLAGPSLKLSLFHLLSVAFPEHSQPNKSKSSYYKKSQFLLKSRLKTMFPQEGKNNNFLCKY
jgi:hypothetical protein